MSDLNPLRPDQKLAATPHDHAWVSASAGTGKTQVLTARVLRLLLDGAAPDKILCLTFTKAAAAEMQTRIYERLAHWVGAGDNALLSDLAALGADTGPDMRDTARQLFAKALDARGGLRVQTLHSFAQGLLASFPIEAGVTPGFTALDDRTGIELRTRVLAEILTDAERLGDSGFIADVQALAVRLGETKLAEVAGELLRHGEAIATLGAPGGITAQLRARLGLPRAGTMEDALTSALSDDAFDIAGLRRFAAAAVRWGTKTGQGFADTIAAWLAAGPDGRLATRNALRKVFLTDQATLRANAKTVLSKDPALDDFGDRIAATLNGLKEMEARFVLADIAAQHLRVGHRLAAAYRAHKSRTGALDFDDMIARAEAMLRQDGMADWVRFKLDQGIDHILVDEGQDTNARQWSIIRSLSEEFYAGQGARDVVRTMFAVGDFKQAIYSFQGSDPQVFEEKREDFRLLADDALTPFHDVALAESFRSTPAVLAVVDRVLAGLGHAALGLPSPPPPHVAARGDLAGSVTLWPPIGSSDEDGGSDDQSADDSEQDWLPETEIRTAQALARQIRRWLETPLMLEAKGRAVRPEDILVLVRKRSEFVGALVAALHAEQVPVAGADRLKLTEPLAVQDMLALVRFALQPDDDLTLAALLVSPFIGWVQGGADDPLFALAHDRPKGMTLWRRLRERAKGDAAAAGAVDWLTHVRNLADLKPPHEFFETILSGPLRGRRRLLERLGEEARDPIEAVLAQALAYEKDHIPSLQGFLAWIDTDDVELKRDPDAPLDAVRIMTVHGAKGLQAPVVVLADAARGSKGRARDHVLLGWGANNEEVPVFFGGKEQRVGPVADAVNLAEALALEEHWRLLYVALTRAEDMLFIGGSLGARDKVAAPDSWHATVAAALGQLDAAGVETDIWGTALVHSSGSPVPAATGAAAEPEQRAAVPDWALRDPAPEAAPPRPLSPSKLGEDDIAQPPPTPAMIDAAYRGQLLHRLFERLPDTPANSRRAVAAAWLARQAPDLGADVRDGLADRALAIIENPDFADLFGPDALAEAPVAAVVGASVISGTVDRLHITAECVRVVDFKTGRHIPANADAVPAYHLRQMAAYAAALARIFPGRTVEAALLYTESATMILLPDALLARHAPGGQA